MYTIDNEKLNAITSRLNDTVDPSVTEEIVEQYICADWSEGEDHQEWIDNADVDEIAGWVGRTAY